MNKPAILDLNFSEIDKQLNEWGEKSYRSQQIWQGLYQHNWSEAEQFSVLPKKLKQKLGNFYSFKTLENSLTLNSSDGQTQKVLFRTHDGLGIETVLMRYTKRNTLCISTQAGCAMGCTFCATGQMGFSRNLTSGEIIEQILYFKQVLHQKNKRITNIVMMGMGEPFHNYDATMDAIDRLNNKDGANIAARRFTISTVGIVPAIRKFTKENRQINLAISLHATEDEARSEIIPINKKYPIAELMNACREYVDKTNRRITIEWALIQDINDSVEQANKLADLLIGLLAHVNIIPLNPTDGFDGQRSSRENVRKFQEALTSRGVPCTIRVRRGIEINAGCGQLATFN